MTPLTFDPGTVVDTALALVDCTYIYPKFVAVVPFAGKTAFQVALQHAINVKFVAGGVMLTVPLKYRVFTSGIWAAQ
jgi:hypothetical protein